MQQMKIKLIYQKKRKTIYNQIGNYFNSPEAVRLFNPKSDESVEDCLSRRIDFFDSILNNREDVSYIVNKESEDNCEVTSKQSIVMIRRILYLQNAYFIMLSNDVNELISFKRCCKKAIKQTNEIDVKIVKNSRTLMQWHRVFQNQEVFPHPNYYVEMGKTDKPIFLQTFPQVKIELCNWGTSKF